MDDFLKPEERCEFHVSEKRKKIWKTQIDLICQLNNICEKYGLKYFASNGTLLGVIRHEGFVPWDDDVDIVMPRPDYDKLLEVAGKELEEPYVLQTADTKGIYFRNFARIRNSETTAMTARGWGRDCCNGIFIDIFPLDGCPDNVAGEAWQRFWFRFYCSLANTHTYYRDFQSRGPARLFLKVVSDIYCKLHGYEHLLKRIEELRTKAGYNAARFVFQSTHGGKYLKLPKKYYEKMEWKKFEYIKLPVSKYSDKILKIHYGNYMELPPVEKRGVHHTIFFDPDRSYKEYLGKMTREEAKAHFNDY